MIPKKSFPVACLALTAFGLIHLPAEYLRAQSPLATKSDESLMRLPAPVEPSAGESSLHAATSGPGAGRRPSATFTFGNGRQVRAHTATSRFRLVGLDPGEIVDVALELPAGLSDSATAQSLDGGKLISFAKSQAGVGGLASIRFQAGNQPGLYRVFIPGSSPPLLLQFWVADAQNPKSNPPVVNPAH